MVIVTLKNGNVIITKKYDYDFYTAKIIVNNEFISKKDIAKIEKQVKKLTLEEIEMLGVEFERLYPREWRYKAQYLINNENYLEDDFIDITDIVKGE